MAQLSTLLARVHDEFPSVPEALALRTLSDSLKEFCTRTHAWQESLPSINLRADRTQYELDFDEGIQLVSFVDVRLDGRKIYPVATELTRLRSYAATPGAPVGFIQWQPGMIELVRPPTEGGRMNVVAALTVKLGATNVDVPDALMDEYGEAVAAGAKARLVRMAGQPWFAPDAALIYSVPFYTAANQAKGRAMTALGAADMQIEMRKW